MTRPALDAVSGSRTRPLDGKRIVLTRPLAQARDFETRVLALGGEPVLAPAIEVVPPHTWTIPDAALRRVGTYDWVAFTSANAALAVVERADAIGVERNAIRARRLAVVGPATATTVSAQLRVPDFVPSTHTAEALARGLVDVENARVLLPRGDLADDTLPVALRSRGAFVDEVVVYRTVPGDGVATIVAGVRDGSIDALLFASASAVRFVAEAIAADVGGGHRDNTPNHAMGEPVAACLGPITAEAARSAGFERVVIAEGTAQNELIDRVALWFAQLESQRGGSS